MEAVQQKTSLDVQMSQRIGPRIQDSLICEKNILSFLESIRHKDMLYIL